MFLKLCLGLYLLGSCFCTVIRTTTPLFLSSHCEYNGKFYEAGKDFRPSPCEFCHCRSDGRPLCAIADCALPACVDAVREPDKCCPVCPNGPNCDYNGHTIKAGEVYRPDSYTECSCPSGFHFGPAQALCSRKAEPLYFTTPTLIVDPVNGK